MTGDAAGTVRPTVQPTGIDGVFLIVPQPIRDDRGWFSRTLDLEWLGGAGLETSFVHHNQSRSQRGVVRGIHVRAGLGEVKLVRCANGAIVDFAVDMRPWSPMFRRVERFELDDDSLVQLYLPPFVAHGFQVMSPTADICYLHSRPYEPGADLSVAWNDPTLAIDWPLADATVSERDRAALPLDALDLDALFERS